MELLLIFLAILIFIYIKSDEIIDTINEIDRRQKSPKPADRTDRPIRGNRFMSTAERNAYLLSPKWKALRQLVIERDVVCQLTGDTTRLEVHHITYDNLGNEYLEDLVLLSRRAHQFVHDYYGSYDRNNTYPIEPLKGLIK